MKYYLIRDDKGYITTPKYKELKTIELTEEELKNIIKDISKTNSMSTGYTINKVRNVLD